VPPPPLPAASPRPAARSGTGGGFFLPGTGRAICVFDAGSAADVAEVNEQAGVPAADVVEVIDLRAAT
jgi:hypothetical protein